MTQILLNLLVLVTLTFSYDLNVLFLIVPFDQPASNAALAYAKSRIANESLLPTDYNFR
jgi:hypothetical protein